MRTNLVLAGIGYYGPIHKCMANATLRESLVRKMHAVADSYEAVPTVLIDNKTSPDVPPPAPVGNDPAPLITAVCRLVLKTGLVLPMACSAMA